MDYTIVLTVGWFLIWIGIALPLMAKVGLYVAYDLFGEFCILNPRWYNTAIYWAFFVLSLAILVLGFVSIAILLGE